MRRKADKMEIIRIKSEADERVFTELSELDKLCVGAEGWSAESFKAETEKENGIVIACMENNAVIGLISGYTAIGEADITSVAVSPEHRRKGIADSLLSEFMEILPEDTEDVFLEVRESNVPAISLYEKHGFERISVRKNFYTSPNENAVVMKKIIIGE